MKCQCCRELPGWVTPCIAPAGHGETMNSPYISPMPTRRASRLYARLLLAALLLLSQHSTWVHELGHLSAARVAAQVLPGGDAPHAQVELCRLCLACAQIDSAAAPQGAALALAAHAPHEHAVLAPVAALHIAAPAQRSRSPPLAA